MKKARVREKARGKRKARPMLTGKEHTRGLPFRKVFQRRHARRADRSPHRSPARKGRTPTLDHRVPARRCWDVANAGIGTQDVQGAMAGLSRVPRLVSFTSNGEQASLFRVSLRGSVA